MWIWRCPHVLVMPLALALFTGSLDSILAVRTLQEQGIEVLALHVRTLFGCGHGDAGIAAKSLGIRLDEFEVEDDYLDVFRRPRFGRGPRITSRIDCRIHIFRMAYRRMEELGAELAISGEILGQRPAGQKRKDLEVIAHHSGLAGHLLRPLSAKLLPETEIERAGVVDRRRLFGFHGAGRRELIELANQWGISTIPPRSNGCAAMQGESARRLHDLLLHQPNARREDFELLRVGLYLRLDGRTKIVLGRSEAENERLKQIFDRFEVPQIALLEPKNFSGPSALVVGENNEAAIDQAGKMMLKKSRLADGETAEIIVRSVKERGHRIRQTGNWIRE
jgi:tRNA-uridine 2-sulfurtransferase